MIKYSPSVSCDINNVTGINATVKTFSMKITTIASNVKDIEGSNSHCLKDIATCSTLPYENISPSVVLRAQNLNNTMCQETLRHLQVGSTFYFGQTHSPPPPLELVTRNIFAVWIMLSKYGWLVNKFFEIAQSAPSSTDYDVIKSRLVQYDKLYGC